MSMSLSGISSNIHSSMSSLMQKLSSGKQITSAGDNAAGLAISEKMSAQISGLHQGTTNLRNMDSFVQVADGALSSITSLVQEANATYIRMNNGIYTEQDKATLQMRIDNLSTMIQGIAQQTNFNGIPVFSDEAIQSQYSSDSSDVMEFTIGEIPLDLSSQEATQETLHSLLKQYGSLGATQNALEHSISVNEISEIQATDSLSQIADADMAQLITEFQSKSLQQQMVFSMMQKEKENQNSVLGLFHSML